MQNWKWSNHHSLQVSELVTTVTSWFYLMLFHNYSDGISHLGALCALTASLKHFKAEQMGDMFHTIKTSCTQRAGMVQTLVSNHHY